MTLAKDIHLKISGFFQKVCLKKVTNDCLGTCENIYLKYQPDVIRELAENIQLKYQPDIIRTPTKYIQLKYQPDIIRSPAKNI